jgi:hypothetical protein
MAAFAAQQAWGYFQIMSHYHSWQQDVLQQGKCLVDPMTCASGDLALCGPHFCLLQDEVDQSQQFLRMDRNGSDVGMVFYNGNHVAIFLL